ncbi:MULTISPECIES: hypothetical protein [Cyanophyceae]|uniref:hypothetical protein n=1 Tax=Cyanophyceae TaxID=3028117 RepID=UPI001684E814|nr:MULTISPECIES: hypothetical protein [Cyanophyceae]MBD1919358.1 hypothetical protein [Phormidium sp. FACHB-77]MBD2054368.1 hypothetical protein [Leptolyngbya sp. FACHB-60]
MIPAGVTHRCSWDSAAQFMALEPDLLQQMGQDWVQADRIELRPQFMESDDGLIATVLSTLKTEAELGG